MRIYCLALILCVASTVCMEENQEDLNPKKRARKEVSRVEFLIDRVEKEQRLVLYRNLRGLLARRLANASSRCEKLTCALRDQSLTLKTCEEILETFQAQYVKQESSTDSIYSIIDKYKEEYSVLESRQIQEPLEYRLVELRLEDELEDAINAKLYLLGEPHEYSFAIHEPASDQKKRVKNILSNGSRGITKRTLGLARELVHVAECAEKLRGDIDGSISSSDDSSIDSDDDVEDKL